MLYFTEFISMVSNRPSALPVRILRIYHLVVPMHGSNAFICGNYGCSLTVGFVEFFYAVPDIFIGRTFHT